MERIVFETACAHGRASTQVDNRCPLESQEFQDLLQRRRLCRDPARRKDLSQQIRKYVRRELRRKKAERFNKILGEFEDLNRLDTARRFPVICSKQITNTDVSKTEYADFLAEIFRTDGDRADLQNFLGFGKPGAQVM